MSGLACTRQFGDGWRPPEPMLLALFPALLIAGLLANLLRHHFVAVPISLQSGIALAAVLCWGRRAAPVVLLAHALVVLVISHSNGNASFGGALAFGASMVAQSTIGAAMLKRLTGERHVALTQDRDILVFVLIGGLCVPLLGAAGDCAALILAYGAPAGPGMAASGVDFWVSKAMGIVVVTPLALVLIGQPRAVWQARKLNTALPLLLGATLLMLVIGVLPRWDAQRRAAEFHRIADAAASALNEALREPGAVLAAADGLLSADAGITDVAFAAAARQFVPPAGAIDRVGIVDWHPASASDGARRVAPPAQRQPFAPAPSAARSPAASAALASARNGGTIAASPALRGGGGRVQVLVARALAGPQPQGVERAVVAVLDLQRLLSDALRRLPAGVGACLLDASVDAPIRLLAGSPGCAHRLEPAAGEVFALDFATRRWTLQLYPTGAAPLHASPLAQLVTVSCLACLGLFTALLLSLSARARAVDATVDARTHELRETSRALHSTEQRLRSVFDSAPVGLYVADLDGRLREANPQFCMLLGCTRAGAAAAYRRHAMDDAMQVPRLVDRPGEQLSLRRRIETTDGRTVIADVRLSLQRDELGRPRALLGVAQDITDRLRLQTLEREREAAEMANRAKNDFLSRMSHQLRTPLNALLGFTQLLQREPAVFNAAQRDWLERIGQAGWHLLAMVNDVLDLTRVESGRLDVAPQPLDAHQLVDESVSLLKASAAQRGIGIELRLAPDARHVWADPTRIREILGNLLSNAIKYNRPSGRVRVTLERTAGGQLAFAVSDTGPGLTAEQLAALFQPFNRLGQERGTIEGSGIGLALSRRLTELMGGTLEADCVAGRGCTFTLRLAAAQAPGTGAAPAPDEASPRWRCERHIVCIEDNAVNAELIEAALRPRGHLHLRVFDDGPAGLAAVLDAPPDLLLLDLHLPGCSALQLLRRLRASVSCATLPVVVVSADAMDASIRAAMDAGASHYLSKPFVVEELLRVIERLLAEKRR